MPDDKIIIMAVNGLIKTQQLTEIRSDNNMGYKMGYCDIISQS